MFCESARQARVSDRSSSSSSNNRTPLLAGAPQHARRAAPALLCSGPLCSNPPAAHLLRHIAGGGAALSAGLRALQGDDQPHACTQKAATVSPCACSAQAHSNPLCTQHSNSLRLRGRALHPPFFLACKADRRQRGSAPGPRAGPVRQHAPLLGEAAAPMHCSMRRPPPHMRHCPPHHAGDLPRGLAALLRRRPQEGALEALPQERGGELHHCCCRRWVTGPLPEV